MTEVSKGGVPLTAIFERMGALALIAAGSIEFIPALFLLVFHAGELPPAIWLTWAIPAAVFIVALLPRFRRFSSVYTASGGLLLLVGAIVFPQTYGPGWLPLPFVAFAVAFGAAFTSKVSMGLCLIGAAAGLNLIAVLHPTPQMILAAADLAGGAIGPVFVLIAGPALLGMAQIWRRTAQIADENTEAMEASTAATYRAVQVQSARTGVDRRIHETVLNTLNAIAQRGVDDDELLRSECRRDVEQMELGALTATEASMSDIIAEATVAAGLRTPEVRTRVDVDQVLPRMSASALRDALVEALRNVERHAQAQNVVIAARQFGTLYEISVEDDGTGLGQQESERFGMRNTMRASLAAMGGEALIDSSPGRGTRVQLRIPVVAPAELRVPIEPVRRILLDSNRSRILLFAPALFGLVMLPWIAGSLVGGGLAYAVLFVAFLATNFALSLMWKTRWRVVLVVLTVLWVLAAYTAAGSSLNGCDSASAVHWIINSVAGGIGLVLFAIERWWAWIILPVVTLGGLVLTFALPSGCRVVPAMSLIVTVVYMSAALFLMAVLFREFDRRRSDALVLWAATVEYQAEIERQIVVTSRWSRVSASTTRLLRAIADGQLDVDTVEVRERAAAEESQLRRNLGLEKKATSNLWQAVLEEVNHAETLGRSVEVSVISMPTDALPVPAAIIEFLRGIVSQAPSRTVTIKALVDEGLAEIIVTAPSVTVDIAMADSLGWMRSTPGNSGVFEIEHFEVSRVRFDERNDLVSIRSVQDVVTAEVSDV